MSVQNTLFSIGIRRSHQNTSLDVLYPHIFTNLTSEQYTLFNNTFLECSSFYSKIDSSQLNSLVSGLHSVGYSKSIIDLLSSIKITNSDNSYFSSDLIFVRCTSLDDHVDSVEHAFFKLQCLSHRLVKPHGLCLDGLFGVLNNIAWSNKGPILAEDVNVERIKHYSSISPLVVSHIDKFPYLVNYHFPKGVRIASGSQVRLGAYLGEGCTVMPAGYVNFNAGSKGSAMVEGRVSAGVFIGDDSDVGGGASIMGTLSGGNNHVISLGAKCLLGANSGVGISLGFGCTVAAGLYVTAGTKVSIYDESDLPVDLDGNVVEEGSNVVKAYFLSGKDNLLFYSDSVSGRVICKPNPKTMSLNETLHSN